MEPAAVMQLAALAAAAAGTGVSIKANRDRTRATNAAALNDIMNKQKVERDSKSLFNQQVQTSDPAKAGEAADQAAQAQYAASKTQDAQSPQGFGGGDSAGIAASALGGSPVIRDAAARSLADALQVADAQIKARAVMGGLSRQRQQRFQQLTRANQQAGMLGNFNQGWNQVDQADQALAQNAGAGTAMLGDVLTGLGQVGSAYAGTQKKPTPDLGNGLTPAMVADPYRNWGTAPDPGFTRTPGSVSRLFANPGGIQ
jgi:hypothetical protein